MGGLKERSYCFGAGKKDSASVKEHLFKMTFYFSLTYGTGMENHAEKLYLFSLKISFDLMCVIHG